MDGIFARADIRGIHLDKVDNTEMDPADFIAVVIKQGNGPLAVGSRNFQLLVQLALDGAAVSGLVEVLGVRVAVIDVAADTDGHFGMEAGFAAGLSPRVAEDPIAAPDNKVGDELFVGRILLGRGAREEEVAARVEEGGHVAVRLEAESFERAQFFENPARHHENVFHLGHGGGG